MIETCANCGHWRGVHHHVNEACPTRWDALKEPVEWSKDTAFRSLPFERPKPAHPSEPWTVREQGEANQFAIITKGGWIIALLCNGELTVEQQRAIMRRMVACVNVCEGIPTEMLESPASNLDKLKSENAGMRGLLQDYLDGLDMDGYENWEYRVRVSLGLVKENRPV